MRAHKSGPWTCERRGPGYYITSPEGHVGQVTTERADVLVMTAGPELLAACDAALHWFEQEASNPGQAPPHAVLRVLRAAVAQARGG